MDIKERTHYYCPFCNQRPQGYLTVRNLRNHAKTQHQNSDTKILERYIVEIRYPWLDIDRIVQRYKDRLETMIGLQKQGIFIKKFLQTIGVARNPQSDKSLMRFLKINPNAETAEDVKKTMEEHLVGKFRDAPVEVRFQGYLNRDMAVLKKNGQEELIPAVKTLKVVKFVKKQLQEAMAETKTAETPEESTE